VSYSIIGVTSRDLHRDVWMGCCCLNTLFSIDSGPETGSSRNYRLEPLSI